MSEKEEAIIVTITGPDGAETDYAQDVVIPYNGKQFAVLVSIPLAEEDDREPDIILARMDADEKGEIVYVPPTDEEYDAVAELYEHM